MRRIKEVRENAGLTQEKFAKRLGIKRNTVATYETTDKEPMDSIVHSICKEFNINEEWLRLGTGEMYAPLEGNPLVAKAAQLLGEKDPVFEAFIETYSQLDSADRKVLLNMGLEFLKNLQEKNIK